MSQPAPGWCNHCHHCIHRNMRALGHGILKHFELMKIFTCRLFSTFNDFLLPCHVPSLIVKPLAFNKHLVSAPLDDKEELYKTALSKQAHSFNELLFISAKVISFMIKSKEKSKNFLSLKLATL